MPNPVDAKTKARRVREMAEVEDETRSEYFELLVGRNLQVLIESIDGQVAKGTSCRYAPVEIDDAFAPAGSLVNVRVIERRGDRLVAKLTANAGDTSNGG
jgi:threonylcarbamoyladenosine tRNA methylthiotransferase MtaB